jgi:hypothetical protein
VYVYVLVSVTLLKVRDRLLTDLPLPHCCVLTFVLSYSCWCGVSEIVYHHFKFTLKIRSDSIIVQKSKQNISFICVCNDGYE